jgi:hypothetical protein
MMFNLLWFPGSANAENFGWDPETSEHKPPIWPRVHLGNDYWSKSKTWPQAVITGAAEFMENDGDGNSILFLRAGAFEIQYYHFYKAELTPETRAACDKKGMIMAGAPLGPAGDVGVGAGRHVHLVIKAKPGTDLSPMLGVGWDEDKTKDFAEKYGDIFLEKALKRGILWMNEDVIYRRVGGGPTAYYINPARVLG